MDMPQVGDVWERDGKRRKVTKIKHSDTGTFYLWWNDREKRTWCSTWYEWASKAKLVERDGKAVGNE
jgi:hypothetical protein